MASIMDIMFGYFFMFIVIQSFSSAQKNKVIYVSKEGHDSANCLSKLSQPCRTVDFVFSNLASHKISNNTRIVLGEGRHNLTRNMVFQYLSNISIEGTGKRKVFVVCKSRFRNVGMQFVRSRGISFSKLSISKCRTAHTSTIITHPTLYSAIFFAYCKDVSFFDTALVQNFGIGITLFDVGGTVNFTGVDLIGNMDKVITPLPIVRNRVVPPIFINLTTKKPPPKTIHMESGGGVYVEFTKCGALDPFNCSALSEQKDHNSNSKYIFHSCFFSRNIAEHKVGYKNVVNLDEQSAFGRGGGLTVLFKGASQNNSLLIENSTFGNNVASWGAGYYIGLLDSCEGNDIFVKKSTFINNFASMGGGGGRVVSLFLDETNDQKTLRSNGLRHEECVFDGNRAIVGGGFSLTGTTRIKTYMGSIKARATELVKSIFRNNLATVGSAIGMNTRNLNNNTIGPGMSYVLWMEDCDFSNNKVIKTEDNRVVGEGAMYSEEVTLVFYGRNTFLENNATALVLKASSVSILGELLFAQNHGIEGGAMSLYGNSWIMLNKGCNLTFIENKADSKAGAIYVKSPGPDRLAFDTTELETGDCFFKYANEKRNMFQPDTWEVSVNFVRNTAAVAGGNAVYSSTLQHCRTMHEQRDKSRALYWKPFHYVSCGNGQPEVVTNPISIQFDQNQWMQPPGFRFSPKLVTRDEKNNSVFGTIKVIVKNENGLLMGKYDNNTDTVEMDYIDDSDDDEPVEIYPNSALFITKDRIEGLEILGREGESFTYQFLTTAGQTIQTDVVKSKLAHCPEGYTQLEGQRDCTCMSKTRQQRGVIRCDKLSIFLQPGYWGATDSKGSFYAVPCPNHYCTCTTKLQNSTSEKVRRAPHHMYECRYVADKQCASGRYGRLCGQCKPGLSVLLGAERCDNCSNVWLLLLIPMGVAGLLAVLIVMYFDINAFAGYFNAFLYSYQIMTLLMANNVKLDSFIGLVIGVTSLSGTGNSQVGVCLFDGFSNMHKLGFNYVLPVYLLLCTILIGICLPDKSWNKLYFRWKVYGDEGRTTSFGHAISFISVLCYSAFTSATLNILHWTVLDNDYVVFKAGSVTFLGLEHLPYAICAFLVLVFIVIGFPIVLVYTPHFTSRSKICLKYEPSLDALKNCFKDGHRGGRDMRPFASFYFICRFIILAIGVFEQEEIGRLVLVTIASILMQAIFSWFQPYKKWTMNFFDTLLLTNLSVIGVLSILLTIPNYLSDSVRSALVVITKILVYLPLVIIVCRGVYVVYEKKKRHKRAVAERVYTEGGVGLTETSSNIRSLSVPLVGSRKAKGGVKFPDRVLDNVVEERRGAGAM